MLNYKSKIQNPKSKINPNLKFQISKQKFSHLSFVLCAYFVICALSFGFCKDAYALNLERAKENFLKGDYAACITECENILAENKYSRDFDELYFLLGLSYLKTENFLRSFDVFEIIVKEFKDSPYKEEALVGEADIYFLKEDYDNAKNLYKQFLENNPYSRLRPLVYFRLAQVNLKIGLWQEANQYKERLEKEYPLSFEKRLSKDLPKQQEFYFTVQVGAFTKMINAQNLCNKLNAKGNLSFIQETASQFGKIYRVRVGKLNSRFEAQELQNKLIQEGYPTKIYP